MYRKYLFYNLHALACYYPVYSINNKLTSNLPNKNPGSVEDW